MRKLISILAAFGLVFILVGAVNAYNCTEHVKYAPNSEGDLMIFPWYWASPGVSTDITITNTSDTHCSVAKVVMRSPVHSEEIMDWLVYLSPKDKWEGTLQNINEKVYLTSKDDSILNDDLKFVDPENATTYVEKEVFTPDCDTNEYGYIEVVEAASWYNSTVDNDSTTCNREIVPKEVVKAHYENEFKGSQIGPKEDETLNILTGDMVFKVPQAGFSAMMRPYVFKDWNNLDFLSKESESGMVLNESRNMIGELEAAMSKDHVAMNFINDGSTITAHWMTFPTKSTEIDTDDCNCTGLRGDINGNSTFFTEHGEGDCYKVKQTICDYNLSEEVCGADTPWSGNSTDMYYENEVNILANFCSKEGFERGWREYKFDYNTEFQTKNGKNGTFTGAPVLPSMLYVNINEGEMSMTKGAWDDGTVDCGDYTYPDYQYSDYQRWSTVD